MGNIQPHLTPKRAAIKYGAQIAAWLKEGYTMRDIWQHLAETDKDMKKVSYNSLARAYRKQKPTTQEDLKNTPQIATKPSRLTSADEHQNNKFNHLMDK